MNITYFRPIARVFASPLQQQAEDDKPKKKKKRKVKNKEKTGEKSPNLELIDPDEPTYCLCDQVSNHSNRCQRFKRLPSVKNLGPIHTGRERANLHANLVACMRCEHSHYCFLFASVTSHTCSNLIGCFVCFLLQVSYGEMIGCDNDSCAIEWFHFNCVNLTNKPKGKWYCPKCRGDKPTVKRTDIK